jgi:asparagine synthase (glutamine-hydrolysing)
MCGICGIVNTEQSLGVGLETLLRMRDSLEHRGPDDAGYYLAPGVALGSRRLSIIDLSERGHMPMSTSDNRFCIVYNGEVYNFRELRRLLEGRGYTFRSNTDTEVVLALYALEGAAMLDRLNGMFAFAIWDNVERTLFLARDRLGVKPLYYTVHKNRLYFASEEKALFAAGIRREFDPQVWDELLHFRYVAGEHTPFRGVLRLRPGHYMRWHQGQLQVRRWWNLAERARSLREGLPHDVEQWFQETFDSAVDLRRISDVPVGVLLSGGLDSSSVAASLASHEGGSPASFTVCFAEVGYDEGPIARDVANRWGLEHHELQVPASDLLSLLREASWLNDEPLVHRNDPHLLAISRFAKSRVTVLLSGEGGDELLGGYIRYRPLQNPRLLTMARPLLPRLASMFNFSGRLRKLADFLALGSNDQIALFNSCELLPDTVARHQTEEPRFRFREEVLSEARLLYPGDFLRQAMYSDQHTFLCSILDRNDRMTMGASIECRVPFLDYRMVETLAALPSRQLFKGRGGKPLLRSYARRRLPSSVLKHRKWGFGVPWSAYLRSEPELREQVSNLPRLSFIREGPVSHARLQTLITEFQRGAEEHGPLIKQVLMLAVWYEAYFGTQDYANRKSLSTQQQLDNEPSLVACTKA